MGIILGLDVSSVSTGYAILKHGRLYKRLDIYYGLMKFSSKSPHPERLSLFREQLQDILIAVEPDVVSIEDVFVGRNAKTSILLGKYSGVACEVVYTTLGIEPIIIDNKAVKKIIGSKDKEDTFRIITEKFNLNDFVFGQMHDVTDALATAVCASRAAGR